jgi:hypothetical protein
MTEIARLIETDFSTADAEYPNFSLRNGLLVLDFVDWREWPVRVRFSNTVGVKWQELDSEGPEDRDDSTYEIVGSSWLKEYLSKEACTPGDALRHYRLCFNACGVLDVLAESMDREDAG